MIGQACLSPHPESLGLVPKDWACPSRLDPIWPRPCTGPMPAPHVPFRHAWSVTCPQCSQEDSLEGPRSSHCGTVPCSVLCRHCLLSRCCPQRWPSKPGSPAACPGSSLSLRLPHPGPLRGPLSSPRARKRAVLLCLHVPHFPQPPSPTRSVATGHADTESWVGSGLEVSYDVGGGLWC